MKKFFQLVSLVACLSTAAISSALAASAPATPATVRVDYQHSGDAKSEQYAIERVLIEPLPWPGNLEKRIDQTNRGK